MKSKKQYIAPALKEYSYESEEGYTLSITNYLAVNEDPEGFGFEHGQEVWSWDASNNGDNATNYFGNDYENQWNWQ